MRLSMCPIVVAFACITLAGPSPRVALAAPSGLPARPLDLDLKRAGIGNVFRLLADVAHRNIELDPCAQGKLVDISLRNAPLPVIFDVLAVKFGLVYDERGTDVYVRCTGDAASSEALLASRVSLAEDHASLPDALGRLAAAAKLDAVDYQAHAQPSVTARLENVRLSTALTALADESGVRIIVQGGKLIVRD